MREIGGIRNKSMPRKRARKWGRGPAASQNAGLSGSEQTQSSSHQARTGRRQPRVFQRRAGAGDAQGTHRSPRSPQDRLQHSARWRRRRTAQCSRARTPAAMQGIFASNATSIDGLVICLPNFGDEIAISELVNEARLDVPILLQASNDEIDKVDVHSRRDAFCGKFSVTNNFYQYGVRFTDTTSHTSDIDGEEFARDLDRFARTCRVVRGLRHARIGSIGARTGAFQTMRFSEKLLQASGLTVVTVDLSEIIFSAKRAWRRRAGSQGEARRDCGLRAHSRPHQAGEDRPSGQMDDRGRSLDRGERVRRQRHPMLAQLAGQFRLRHLRDHEHDGREARAQAPAKWT